MAQVCAGNTAHASTLTHCSFGYDQAQAVQPKSDYSFSVQLGLQCPWSAQGQQYFRTIQPSRGWLWMYIRVRARVRVRSRIRVRVRAAVMDLRQGS